MTLTTINNCVGLISFHEFSDIFLEQNCWQSRLAQKLFDLSTESKKIFRSRCVAAVVKNRKVLAIGKNSPSSTRLARRFKKNEEAVFEHAEIAAIKKGIRTGKHFDTIFVVRTVYLNGVWQLANAKPCIGCSGAIRHYNIKCVFYSTFQT